MFFSISLYVSLAIFGVGLIYKTSTWFRYNIGVKDENIGASSRFSCAVKGILACLFSAKIITLLKVFFTDVVFQTKIMSRDFTRWLMHICIYLGFTLLLLMHALEKFISKPLFADYYSTINPFLFLRDFFSVLVILGIAIAIYRRVVLKVPRLSSHAMDYYAIIILTVIMISGIALEGMKITSYTAFQGMVEDYAGLSIEDDADEIKALESLWVQNYGLVSPNVKGPFSKDILAQGQESHEANCADCHSSSKWAFTGYAVAKIIKPVAIPLDRAGASDILWYIHFLACFIGLAYLPFSKMFHIFASPISILANAVMDKDKSDPANIATRQVMELDACTHCCTCSMNCSAVGFYEYFDNINVLPSEKIISIKALASGKELDESQIRHIQEGIYLCTNCYRCTAACPCGINLQDLWFNVKESLPAKGYPEFFSLSSFSFYRGLRKSAVDENLYDKPLDQAKKAIADGYELIKTPDKPLPLSDMDTEFAKSLYHGDKPDTFSVCFGCETCTTVCPVVACCDNPKETLGLLPHQIMNACGLGIKDLALGSNMLWDCVTCYKCQEECPQGVAVTDIIYELKNKAVRQVKKVQM